MVKRFS